MTAFASRHLLLATGAAAILGGIALASLQFAGTATPPPSRHRTAAVNVLTAMRTLPVGTIVRPEDLVWRPAGAGEENNGSLLTGSSAADAVCAAVRREINTGEALTTQVLVKPGDAAFLPTVLRADSRAVTIPLANAVTGSATVLAPGDRVDVILTQTFGGADVRPSQRSVSETILRGIKVIAIDYSATPANRAAGLAGRAPAAEARQQRTITVEVTPAQAEALLIAIELGKVELLLRGITAPETPDTALAAPTWAGDVSPALEQLHPLAEPRQSPRAAEPRSIQIMRGGKVERLCIDGSGSAVADCGKAP